MKLLVSQCFGKVLKEIRESSGRSQDELADESQLNRTYISFLERG